jgi:RNA polymerase sigma-70 factor (ECF subfamily)
MHAEASRPAAHRPNSLEIVESFQAGRREESFRQLFDTYHRPLRRFFARKGLPPELCCDLAQETFLCVYRGLGSYEPQGRFETWLYRVATTTYLKHLRSRTTAKRAGDEVSAEALDETARPLAAAGLQLDRMLDDERRRALRRAVGNLPERMRRCLELKVYRDLGCREIAAALEVSIGTVKTHLFQARGKLRQELAGLAA